MVARTLLPGIDNAEVSLKRASHTSMVK